MIRPIEEKDFATAIHIINENWKTVYSGFLSYALLDNSGCKKREAELISSFQAQRLKEYVWEENGRVLGLLSIGYTADPDKAGAFEIWRLYVAPKSQGKKIGSRLLAFAGQYAGKNGFTEIIIWAFRKNIHALSFYQKHGYRIDKTEYLEPYQTYGTRLCKSI